MFAAAEKTKDAGLRVFVLEQIIRHLCFQRPDMWFHFFNNSLILTRVADECVKFNRRLCSSEREVSRFSVGTQGAKTTHRH